MSRATDILVDTHNPAALDRAVQQFGAAVVGGPDYIKHEGYYVVRTFMDPVMIEVVMTNQGYATVIRRLEKIL